MLYPHQFGAGPLSAARPLSLVLPRDQYELTFIVGTADSEPVAVCLSGQWKFMGMSCGTNSAHGGLIVPSVDIQVDQTSLFKLESGFVAPGTVVRNRDGLFLAVRPERYAGGITGHVCLVSDLPVFEGHVGFTRWSVSLGTQADRQILCSVDALQQDNDGTRK